MARALVTGATGLVGSHLVERLQQDGWTVRALVRDRHASGHRQRWDAHRWLRERDVELASGDVLDFTAFSRAAENCEAIFHAAAAITPRGGWETFKAVNVDGARNAVGAAARSGARLVHISSVAVYGPRRYDPSGARTEESGPLPPIPPNAFYQRSKRESELLVLGAHAEGRIWATAVRPCVVYGPRDRQFVPRIARLVSTGLAPRIGKGTSILSVVHAANVADGAVRALLSGRSGGRAYNLANDFEVSVTSFLRLAGEGVGRRVRFVPVPRSAAHAILVVGKAVASLAMGGGASVVAGSASLDFLTRDNPFSSALARRELGWTPVVRPEEGVPDAFRWWKAHV